jgi:hypothetical protein
VRCLGSTVAHIPCLASCALGAATTSLASTAITSILFPAVCRFPGLSKTESKARARVLPVMSLDHGDGEGGGLSDKGG